MAEAISENQGLYFQPSYDRAAEAQLEHDLIDILGKLREYCLKNTGWKRDANGVKVRNVAPITDFAAFKDISEVFDQGKILLSKYKEEAAAVENIDTYLKFLSKQTALNTDATIDNLEMLSNLITKHLGQNQQFKDKTHAKFVWDNEIKKN